MAEAKKVTKEPKVTVFNEVVDEEGERTERFTFQHRRHGSLTWGLIFILVGVVFLLSNFGAVSPDIWNQLSRLWPIIIILIGVETLFGHSDTSDLVSSLIGVFVFATIIGVIFLQISPDATKALPAPILNYLNSISNFLKLK